ncbi:MAG: GlgB N-terminal domain-containing protein, partial [Rhodospirillales bacterium]
MANKKHSADIDRILHGDHNDPFSFLGMHIEAGEGKGAKSAVVVRTFQPQAKSVSVIDDSGKA